MYLPSDQMEVAMPSFSTGPLCLTPTFGLSPGLVLAILQADGMILQAHSFADWASNEFRLTKGG